MSGLSLIDRITMPAGPTRNKSGSGRVSPYPSRPNRAEPKPDVNAAWGHDKFEEHNSLAARLKLKDAVAPNRVVRVGPTNGIFNKALGGAVGSERRSANESLSIKGASTPQAANIVEVAGLVGGTTAADVEAIFKQCGAITKSEVIRDTSDSVTIRIVFKATTGAKQAVEKFHNMQADGRKLSVTLVGITSTNLAGRMGNGGAFHGDSVDVLMDSSNTSSSKMRSDELLSEPGSIVQIAPPGADPKDYTQQSARGRGRGGRGGGARGGRR